MKNIFIESDAPMLSPCMSPNDSIVSASINFALSENSGVEVTNQNVYIDPLFNAPHWILDDEEEKRQPIFKKNRLLIATDFLNSITLDALGIDSKKNHDNKKSFILRLKGKKELDEKKRNQTYESPFSTVASKRKKFTSAPLPPPIDEYTSSPQLVLIESTSSESSNSDDSDSNQSKSSSSSSNAGTYLCAPPSRNRQHWESVLIKSGVVNSRLLLARERCAPMMVCSTIYYKPQEEQEHEEYPSSSFLRHILDTNHSDDINHYLNRSYEKDFSHPDDEDRVYDPSWLDDPNIKSGKHRTVINLPGFIGSTIAWVKEYELRDELNKQFRLKHEWLPPSLTLSKIRKVKKLIVNVMIENNLEASTASLASIYFERLVLKRLVDKFNRKLVGSVCILLACKFNEIKIKTQDILNGITKHFETSPSDIVQAEFPVLCELGFCLTIATVDLFPQFGRILSSLDTVPLEYLGEETYEEYFGTSMDSGLGTIALESENMVFADAELYNNESLDQSGNMLDQLSEEAITNYTVESQYEERIHN